MAKVCGQPGCPEIADGTHCAEHKPDKSRQRSERGQRAQRLFRTKRWQAKARRQVQSQPYCECPYHAGQFVRADTPELGGAVADHVYPHGGDERKFWNGKLMTLTRYCHATWKQQNEASKAQRSQEQ